MGWVSSAQNGFSFDHPLGSWDISQYDFISARIGGRFPEDRDGVCSQPSIPFQHRWLDFGRVGGMKGAKWSAAGKG
jgi:hypothetical protein